MHNTFRTTAVFKTFIVETTTASKTTTTISKTNSASEATTTASDITITASETASETTFETTSKITTTVLKTTFTFEIIFETTTSKTTAIEIITNEAAIEQGISYMPEMHQSISALLKKYHTKLDYNSVDRKKSANKTIKARTEVAIAPNHDINQQTCKRKLQLTFSAQGVFKSLKSNNYTAVVKVNSEDIRVPVK
ncbi:858_t:CDS:2 [Cetraspora pellucida]|uniref:858_t:CDS:1 n=1 Tax=Cetraspora pellucida TaxID=1433469 RepID=A0ACA9N3C3_9GLOM|nr:858_t:CDS:2 [Cetraspora pellucida]